MINRHQFNIPMTATINVELHEANIDLAISQAEGELEQLFDLLDDLCHVDSPNYNGQLNKNTLIDLIQVAWGKMSIDHNSIVEAKNEF